MTRNRTRRVAVTGVGIVSPYGGDVHDFFARTVAGESSVGWYRQPDASPDLAQPAAVCRGFDSERVLGRQLSSLTDRFAQLGIAAAFSAWRDAGLAPAATIDNPFCVSWGTGIGGTLTIESGYVDYYKLGRTRASPLSVPMAMNSAAASQIAIALGLGGACLTYSVACASSTVAIGEAFRRIKAGETPIALAGGSEAPLSFSVMRAWEGMRVVAECTEQTAHQACRPFHARRSGLVLAEGAAALILEDFEHASERGARIYCELAGFGQSCDHTHLVRPSAEGQSRALRAAMAEADLQAADVGYVNAHAAGTREGDAIEIASLKSVFGSHAADLLVSSTKSMHGHSLGAAGAVEALVAALAVHEDKVPPTANLDEVGEECQGVRHVVREGVANPGIRAAISNSFAFGGSNAVLAFRAVD